MNDLMDQVREAINKSGMTRYAICKELGLAQSQLSRLMSGETGLRMDALQRLVDLLGFEIVLRPKYRQRKRKTKGK
jgi:transcriptional regulator with XRE-family HTH domain